MTLAKFCDICGNAYKSGQVGSIELTVRASYGIRLKQQDMDICAGCNPFLEQVKEDLATKLSLQAEKD